MRFRVVRNENRIFPDIEIKLPERKTRFSAGYDFYSNEDYVLKPNEMHVFWTDTKIELALNLFLQISIRSSLGGKGLSLANSIGIIDSDYYENESNDGNIGIMIRNNSKSNIKINRRDRIAQGIILSYFTVEENEVLYDKRKGGFGSTKDV